MINSMTGYGRAEVSIEDIVFTVEIKTLNSRYKDIIIKMPREIQELEMDIRSWLSEKIKRGRLELYIKMEALPEGCNYELVLNESLAKAYIDIFERLSKSFNIDSTISIDTLCKLKDVIIPKAKQLDIKKVKAGLRKAINNAIFDVEKMRREEGDAIENDILKRLLTIEEKLGIIKQTAPQIVESYRKRLKENIKKLLSGIDVEINEDRIEQEVVLFAERSDITEEIVRMESHLNQFRKYMHSNDSVGRRLDFLIQEMNREINTIGAKAPDTLISTVVVDIKAEIEKVREQVQNIE